MNLTQRQFYELRQSWIERYIKQNYSIDNYRSTFDKVVLIKTQIARDNNNSIIHSEPQSVHILCRVSQEYIKGYNFPISSITLSLKKSSTKLIYDIIHLYAITPKYFTTDKEFLISCKHKQESRHSKMFDDLDILF